MKRAAAINLQQPVNVSFVAFVSLCSLDCTGAQAGSANVSVLRYAVNLHFDTFNVGLPHSVCFFM